MLRARTPTRSAATQSTMDGRFERADLVPRRFGRTTYIWNLSRDTYDFFQAFRQSFQRLGRFLDAAHDRA